MPSTTATVESLELQLMLRPESGSEVASDRVAANCMLAPTAMVEAFALNATVATGTGSTPIIADPATPSLVAVMVAECVMPSSTTPAVTSPFAVTLATEVSEEDQLTGRPVRDLPADVRTDAVMGSGARLAIVAVDGDTLRLATASGPVPSPPQAAASTRPAHPTAAHTRVRAAEERDGTVEAVGAETICWIVVG